MENGGPFCPSLPYLTINVVAFKLKWYMLKETSKETSTVHYARNESNILHF